MNFSLQKAADISGIAGKIRRLSLHDAAMQIGDALGTAVLTSVLMAVARAAYYRILEPNRMRPRTNEYSNCELPNLGYTGK